MKSRRPVLCLVTDRRRLVAAVAESETHWQTLLVSQITGAIAGGVDVVQVREPDLEAGALAGLVRDCLHAAAGTPVRIVVNDRLDVALATGAHGVHLRGDGLPNAAARRIAPAGLVIGRSVHDAAGAAAAGDADYLIAGSVFATSSKPHAPALLGLDGLAAVVAAAAGSPVWAIGGVNAERIPQLVARGVSGVAAIGAFVPLTRAADLAAAVHQLTNALRAALDADSDGQQRRANPR
jgi:thiamine-phosphate diphosphorylase